MGFSLSSRDRLRLSSVHPDLSKVVEKAASEYDGVFMVVEGARTVEAQRANVAKGVSKTMNSLHLPQKDGLSHAVDLAPLVGGAIPWSDKSAFKSVAECMKKCASDLEVEIEWGGDWRSFYDGPHFQLSGKYRAT